MKKIKFVIAMIFCTLTLSLWAEPAQSEIWSENNGTVFDQSSFMDESSLMAPTTRSGNNFDGELIEDPTQGTGLTPVSDVYLLVTFVILCYGAYLFKQRRRKQRRL